MIRLKQVKVRSREELEGVLPKKLKTSKGNILSYRIHKESIDARHKPDVFFVYEVDVCLKDSSCVHLNDSIVEVDPKEEEYVFPSRGDQVLKRRPVVVGSGPAGLFCAYILSLQGMKPIVIERGSDVDTRVRVIREFWEKGILNTQCNVQFGEGGAGTFSDGKLGTLVKDPMHRMRFVYETFVKFGADPKILYENKAHIGTDVLIDVVRRMRLFMESLGATFRFNCEFVDYVEQDGAIREVILGDGEKIPCDVLVLAIGHSARNTFEALYQKGLPMEGKPFAVGLRVVHPQPMIDQNQYGALRSDLPVASYKLTAQSGHKRGVYTFCMCPGGYVVNASSEEGMTCVNGMSESRRDSGYANSAVIVTVGPKDFGMHPLDGMRYQRELEEKAFFLGQGKIPVQLLGDFLNRRESISFGSFVPEFKGEYAFGRLDTLFSDSIYLSFLEGMKSFGKKIKGFDREDTVLAGVEARTSSPIRIGRGDTFETSVSGIYPCGEGAGYAGGITSAAMDGMKVAEAILKKYA